MFDYRKSRELSTEATRVLSVSSLGFVISPLIALMIDQVRYFRRRDVPSAIAASGAGGRIDQDLLASKRDISVYRFLFCTVKHMTLLVTCDWRMTTFLNIHYVNYAHAQTSGTRRNFSPRY